MTEPILTEEQKNNIRLRIAAYKEWLTTSHGLESVEEHRNARRKGITRQIHIDDWPRV